MIARTIAWSSRNLMLVLIGTVFAVAAGLYALRGLPLDAIPDLSDVQVIVYTEYSGQAPQVVEDQVTYPLTTPSRQPGRRSWRVHGHNQARERSGVDRDRHDHPPAVPQYDLDRRLGNRRHHGLGCRRFLNRNERRDRSCDLGRGHRNERRHYGTEPTCMVVRPPPRQQRPRDPQPPRRRRSLPTPAKALLDDPDLVLDRPGPPTPQIVGR